MTRPPWTLDGHAIPANILEAIGDRRWWGRWFERGDWSAWQAFLAALFGLPLEGDALATYRACTGREAAPVARAKEAWLVVGRRGGKSRVLALVASWLSCFCDWRPFLSPGEIGVVQVIAADRAQARTVLRYLRSFITQHPLLKQLVKRETAEEIELSCSIAIQVTTASFRIVRGFTLVAALCDELGYWWTDEHSANPDSEVIAALRPAMATVPGAMLLCASSPYMKRGALWSAWRRFFGQDGAALIWQAPTRVMNPSVPQVTVDEALELDPARYGAEYLAQWRDDLASYISRDLVERAVDRGVVVRALDPRHRYTSFVDASSGQADAFAAAVAHREGDLTVLDAIVEIRAPFDTAVATAQVAATLRSYGLHDTMGDDHAKGWVISEFGRHGVTFKSRPVGMDRSALYLEVLPAFSAGRVRLIDNARLTSQFCALERRVMPGGRDRVDHPNRAGHHDDLANACAGALWRATSRPQPLHISETALARSRQPASATSRWPRREPRWFF